MKVPSDLYRLRHMSRINLAEIVEHHNDTHAVLLQTAELSENVATEAFVSEIHYHNKLMRPAELLKLVKRATPTASIKCLGQAHQSAIFYEPITKSTMPLTSSTSKSNPRNRTYDGVVILDGKLRIYRIRFWP